MNGAVANVLNTVLGTWIDNINSEQLKLSVFSGEVFLKDLRLKASAISSLGLPIKLVHGTIGKLSVKIPWTSLASSSLEIEIAEINVLISPASPDSWSEENEIKNVQNFKKSLLDNHEAMANSEITVSEEKGFLEKLVNKIVQNVQVSIKSLYVRYEDSLSSTRPFSAGVAIQELKAVTCNASWEPEFIHDVVLNYKLAQLNSFRVFMDSGPDFITDSRATGDFLTLSTEEFEGNQRHNYILSPTTYSLRVIINTNPKDTSIPEYSLHLTNTSVEMAIDSEQIVHTLKILEFMNHFEKFKQGIQLSLKDPEVQGNDVEDYRERYRTYRLSVKNKNTEEKSALEEFERKYDVYSLLGHRRVVDKSLELLRKEKDIKDEIKKVENEGQDAGAFSKLSGFLWGKSDTQKKEEEETKQKKLQVMKKKLEEIVDEKNMFENEKDSPVENTEQESAPKEFVVYLIKFEVESTVFLIKHESETLMSFEMNKFAVEVGMRPSTLYAKLQISDTSIRENIVNSQYFPYILQGDFLDLYYDTLPSTKISMKSGGIILVANFQSIFRVYSVLTAAMSQSSTEIRAQYLQQMSLKTAEYVSYGESYMKDFMKTGSQASITLEMHLKAPLICVPLDIFNIDSGMLVIDLGNLETSTSVLNENGYKFDKFSFVFAETRACIVWSCSAYHLWREGLRSEILMPVNLNMDIKNCQELQYKVPAIQTSIRFSPTKIILQDEVLVFLLRINTLVQSNLPKSEPAPEEVEIPLMQKTKSLEVTEAYKDQMKKIDQIIAVSVEVTVEEVKIVLSEKHQDLGGVIMNSMRLKARLGNEGEFNGELTLARFEFLDMREEVLLGKVISNPLLEQGESEVFYDTEQEEILQVRITVLLKPKSDMLDAAIYLNDMRVIASADFFQKVKNFFVFPMTTASDLSVPAAAVAPSKAVSKYTTTFNTRIVIQLSNFELWLPLSTTQLKKRVGYFYFGTFIEYRSTQTYTSSFDKYNYEISRDYTTISDEAYVEITSLGGIIGLINRNRVVLSEERTHDLFPPSRIGVYYLCTKAQNEAILIKFSVNLESMQFDIGFRDIQYFKSLMEAWQPPSAQATEAREMPAVQTKMELQLECDSFKITVLEDTGVKAYALLHYHMSSLKASASLDTDHKQASLSTFMYSDYYNLRICAWEPLLENWNFAAVLLQKDANSPLQVEIDSPNMLDLNLTMNMVEILGTLMRKLGQDSSFWTENAVKEIALTDQNELLAHGQFFYVIENQLGCSIQVWLDLAKTEVDTWQMGPGQSQMFSYQQLQDKINSSSAKKGLSNGITEEVQAPISLCLKIDGYDLVKELYFERIGVRGFQLVSPERTVNCVLEVASKENLRVISIETSRLCMNNTSCPLVLICGSNEHELEVGMAWPVPLKWISSAEKPVVLCRNGQAPLFENKAFELITGDWAIQTLVEFRTETAVSQTIIQFNPPLSFENLLPGLMTVYADKSEIALGCINAGTPMNCQKLNPNTPHEFMFKVELEGGNLITEWALIKSKKQNIGYKGSFPGDSVSMISMPLEFKKCKNLDLSQRKKKHDQDAGDTIRSKIIEIYSHYCVVNKTDMHLELLDHKTSIISAPHSVSFFKSKKLQVRIQKGEHEASEISKSFNIAAVGVSGCISIPFKKSSEGLPSEIQIGVRVFNATAPLVKSKIVYLCPRFMINNSLGFPVFVRQYFKDDSASALTLVEDKAYLSYHLEDPEASKMIQISRSGEHWSSAFSVQNIEDFQVKFLANEEDRYSRDNKEWNQPSVLNGFNHIVRVIVTTEDQATIHTVLTTPKDSEFSINNCTHDEVTVRQAKFPEIIVPGQSKVPWAFDDLLMSKTLTLTIRGKTKEINIEKVKKSKKFGRYRIENRVIGVTRELTITLTRGSIDSELDIDERPKVILKVVTHLRGFGISIISSKPRELFYFSTIEIHSKFKLQEKKDTRKIEYRTKFRLSIGKIQIDYMLAKNNLFAVIFGPMAKAGEEVIPMFQFEVDKTSYQSISKEDNSSNFSIDRFSWVEVALQEMKLNVNQEILSKLMELSQDILSNLYVDGSFKPLPPKLLPMVSICASLDASPCRLSINSAGSATKTYFKLVHLCAIKILVTFKLSNKSVEINIDPREGFGLMQLFGAIGGAFVSISDSPLYFKEVFIQESFQTVYNLAWQVISNYQRQGILQFYKILGSSDLLGNPVGLIDKLGTGVLELFNEPIKGVLKGPKAFAQGVSKGIRSLVGNVVAGSFGSISKITGNLYGLVLEVGGDSKGADRLNEGDNAFDNIYQGLKGGVIHLAEGVTGIFLKPWKGAKQGGAKGLFKGIGAGLLGIVTSPLSAALRIGTGITTGVTNAATFLAKGKVTPLGRVRFPRHFNPRKVLEAYNFEVAEAQDFLRGLQEHRKEQIVFYLRLEEEESLIIIITLKYFLFIVNTDLIQHYELNKINSLEVHMPEDDNFYLRIGCSNDEALVISSQNYSPLIKLYSAISSLTTPGRPQKGAKKILAPSRHGHSCCKPKRKDNKKSKYSLSIRK